VRGDQLEQDMADAFPETELDDDEVTRWNPWWLLSQLGNSEVYLERSKLHEAELSARIMTALLADTGESWAWVHHTCSSTCAVEKALPFSTSMVFHKYQLQMSRNSQLHAVSRS
jgi:hypothetical protein